MRVFVGGTPRSRRPSRPAEPIRVWHLLTHTAGLTSASCTAGRSTRCTATPGPSSHAADATSQTRSQL